MIALPLAVLLQGAPVASPPVLGSVIAFDGQCNPEPAFDALLNGLMTVEADGSVLYGKPVVPSTLAAAFGRPVVRFGREFRRHGLRETVVPVTGTWRGLRLVEVGHHFVPGTDRGGFSLRFAARAGKVEAALRGMGLRVRTGKTRDVSNDGMSVYATLAREKGGSTLTCGT